MKPKKRKPKQNTHMRSIADPPDWWKKKRRGGPFAIPPAVKRALRARAKSPEYRRALEAEALRRDRQTEADEAARRQREIADYQAGEE